MSDLQPGPAIWRYRGPSAASVVGTATLPTVSRADLIELRNLLKSIDARLRTLECEVIRQREQTSRG